MHRGICTLVYQNLHMFVHIYAVDSIPIIITVGICVCNVYRFMCFIYMQCICVAIT